MISVVRRSVLALGGSALMVMTGAVGGSVAAGAQTAPAASSACPAAVVMPARGSGDPVLAPQRYGRVSSDGYEGPLFGTLLAATYAGAPADVAAVPVVTTGPGYQAVSIENGTRNRSFGVSIASGVSALIARYDSVAAAGGPGCRPTAVLLGYSQGAAVVRTVARQLAPRGVVGAVMLFGDPLQIPGGDGVHGAGSTGTGIWRNDVTAAVSVVDNIGADTYYRLPGIARWSLCHGGDPVCGFGPGADLLGQQHVNYLRAGLRYVPAAGRPASSRTELQEAVSVLRGFLRTASRSAGRITVG
ncbi:cutinase family protein [Williamsia sp. MIQD14]|uniref:cutinase family protein n=1 Tax=Williamsia sp. MIQD14 TaxID=3425703 RepID=UPI003DA18839